MSTLLGLVIGIIRELKRLENIPMEDCWKDEAFSFPRLIDAGNGESLIVSRGIDEGIELVAKQFMNDDPSLKPKFTQAEWLTIVRRTFGPVLTSIDLEDDIEKNASTVLTRVKESIGQHALNKSVREFVFGCTLFEGQAFKSFSIGPVLFEPRNIWLERKCQDDGISQISKRRIEGIWQGKKLRKRKPSFDSSGETHVVNTIGSCKFVCSIKTNDLASEAGCEKALMAARLAITAIALVWKTPSKALNGINLAFDRQPHLRTAMNFIAGKGRLYGGSSWSHLPFGPHIKPDEWEVLLKEREEMFSVVGKMLDYVISSDGDVDRPQMMSTLFHSFLWFHEGCRESSSHMAVVKLAASLDALACGRKSGGILTLIKARLRMEKNAPIHPGGPTLKSVIERIYSEGRSRLVHGNNQELRNDWSDMKSTAEQLGRLCLLFCIDWIAKNPNCDDPKQLALSEN